MLKAKDAEYFTNIDIGFASSVYVVTARVRNLARMHSPMLRLGCLRLREHFPTTPEVSSFVQIKQEKIEEGLLINIDAKER